ncbi:Tautomerase/MIF superfamily [Schizophyllum commune]
MPLVDLATNVSVADVKALSLELSKAAAQILGKPEAFVGVRIQAGEVLSFGGSHEPAYMLSVTDLNTTREINEARSKALSEWLTEKLGLPNDRGLIAFIDPGANNLGFKGTSIVTFFESLRK